MRSSDNQVHNRSLNKPSYSGRTSNRDVSEQVEILMMREVPTLETSFSINSKEAGQRSKYVISLLSR